MPINPGRQTTVTRYFAYLIFRMPEPLAQLNQMLLILVLCLFISRILNQTWLKQIQDVGSARQCGSLEHTQK
jgi:hypothetical protein